MKEAEQKRDQILQEAAAEAQKKVDSIRQEAEAEQFRLAAAQKETAGYVAKVKALHAQAQAYLDQLDQLVPQSPTSRRKRWRRPSPTLMTASSAWWPRPWRRPLRRTRRFARPKRGQSAEDLSDTAEFPAQKVQPEENEDLEKTTRIDFERLQFGRDYEIK